MPSCQLIVANRTPGWSEEYLNLSVRSAGCIGDTNPRHYLYKCNPRRLIVVDKKEGYCPVGECIDMGAGKSDKCDPKVRVAASIVSLF